MARFSARARILTSLVVVSTGVIPVVGSASVASAGADPFDATMRGRAGKLIATLDAAVPPPSAHKRFVDSSQGDRNLLGGASADATVAALPQCYSDQIWVDSLTDRTVVYAGWQDAASLTLYRKRNQGTWRQIAVRTGPRTVLVDTGVNPRAAFGYRVIARNASGSKLGDCESASHYGVWRDNGWGYPDAVAGHYDSLALQAATRGWGDPPALAKGATWVTPAFSADGRLVAATRVDPTTRTSVLEVRRVRTGAVAFSVDLGAATAPADAAFSPDGQTLAYTRYDAATGEPRGLGFVDVFGTHAKRSIAANVPVAEPAWRPDGTLVVTTFGDQPGLAALCSTCTVVSPIAGTTGGHAAEVAPNNALYFTVSSDTSSSLKRISSTGSLGTVFSTTDGKLTSPRVTYDGTVFVERDRPIPESERYDAEVLQLHAGGFGRTSIGYHASAAFYGYDIRQPQNKGNSDFAGDGTNDLVVRDSSGALWAYPRSDIGIGTRKQLGSGWSGFTAILPMDLTSDDRADIVARDSAGRLWLYPGVAAHRFGKRVQIGSSWNGRTLVAPGDWNGDDRADLISRDSAGTLWLYPGTGTGRLGPRVAIATGWSSFNIVAGAGDFNLDNKADLLARDASGRTYIYPGNGTGKFLPRVLIGATTWGSFTAIVPVDVTNQITNVFTRAKDGSIGFYGFFGEGYYNPRYVLNTGWNGRFITA